MIDLRGLNFSSGGSAAIDPASGILTVTEGANQYQQALSGTYTNVTLRVAADSGIGTLVTMASNSPCFVAGTRMLTDHGEIPVEALSVGDRLRLLDDNTAAIVWIGHRRVDCQHHPHPELAWPVRRGEACIRPGKPHRELFLSPDHAIFVEDVLIPVKYLINGGCVAQVKVAEVTYYHVELATHEVVISEGLPSQIVPRYRRPIEIRRWRRRIDVASQLLDPRMGRIGVRETGRVRPGDPKGATVFGGTRRKRPHRCVDRGRGLKSLPERRTCRRPISPQLNPAWPGAPEHRRRAVPKSRFRPAAPVASGSPDLRRPVA